MANQNISEWQIKILLWPWILKGSITEKYINQPQHEGKLE